MAPQFKFLDAPTMDIRNKTHQNGFSIIEMMISITIGLIILAGLTAIFISNSRARTEIERANRQIENGRYALQLLSDDVRLAGYYAEFDPSGLTSPGALPDPCVPGLLALRDGLPLHVQGDDNAATIPSCISDVKPLTDILVIRRASTCQAGIGDCDPVAANLVPYFQASLCSNPAQLNFPIVNNSSYLGRFYDLDTNPANLTLNNRDCTTVAALHRYLTHIYFIANNNKPGDGIPTLKRAELGAGPAFTIVALVDGIENLQLQYGIDSPTVDGAPDSYNAAPASVNDWRAVVSIKINLLARNTEPTSGYNTTSTSTKTYTLGYDASGALITVGPFTDSFKRHAYQSEVRVNNAAGRNVP
jgi:type IV pilus assembly protein PilW